MNIHEAAELMKQGKKIRRTLWNHFMGTPSIGFNSRMALNCSESFGNTVSLCYKLSLDDLLAVDWEVVQG